MLFIVHKSCYICRDSLVQILMFQLYEQTGNRLQVTVQSCILCCYGQLVVVVCCVTAVSTNDHKRLTNQIEQLMHELHAEARKAPALDAAKRNKTTDVTSSSLAAPAQSAAVMASSSAPVKRPFAVIDEVSAASPAEEAGLQIGDQLISFADITAQTANTLPAIAATLQVQLDVPCCGKETLKSSVAWFILDTSTSILLPSVHAYSANGCCLQTLSI